MIASVYSRFKNNLKKWEFLYRFLKETKFRAIKLFALIDAFLFRLKKILCSHNDHNELLSRVEFDSLDELVSQIRERESPRFFCNSDKEFSFSKYLLKRYKSDIENKASEIVKHKFKILGQIMYFDKEIEWHLDPQSGYKWPLKYYKRLLPVSNIFNNTDGKYPYELSRFTHLNTLGIAFRLDRNKKYVQEFIYEVESWLDSNPYLIGINWTCTMDVAIRVCNLIAGFYFFKDSKRITDGFLLRLLESFYQHGKYIMDNLEYNELFTTNHYLSNIAGLIYLGVVFPEFKEAIDWKKFGIKELIREMEKQVYPDGCDFEASTCYHRLVLELFFFSTLLVVINESEFKGENYERVCQKIFGEKYTKSLYKMFEAILYLLKPNGRMPQIGDNDSGRFHVFANREILDMRYLLTLGAIFFSEPKFKVREFGFCEEAFWIFREKGYKIWRDLEENSYKNINSRAFNNAGLYVMRNNKDYCLVSCGPNGQRGNGGHAHNDKLSFELMMDGRDIFLDPGTYVYTSYPKERNKFRSTEYHNTIKFNDYEQNEILEKDMFSLPEKIKIKEANLKEIGNNIFFQGEIQYAGITHKRMIILDNESGSWKIKDNISCSKPLNEKLKFHLSPNLTSDGNFILIKETRDKIASIEVTGSNIEKDEYDYSPEYGQKVKADCLVANISTIENLHEVNTYIRKMK